MPHWMWDELQVEEHDIVQVSLVQHSPHGKIVKLQPLTSDFLDISDPKTFLERCFQNFACLTSGSIVQIPYNEHIFKVKILETIDEQDEARDFIYIINCDLNVDFEKPADYVEPNYKEMRQAEEELLRKYVDTEHYYVREDGSEVGIPNEEHNPLAIHFCRKFVKSALPELQSAYQSSYNAKPDSKSSKRQGFTF
ncbi:MAG: Ubiquitin recognition factor in ER-associated degradation protein 1 [Marteilia pararefringens]